MGGRGGTESDEVGGVLRYDMICHGAQSETELSLPFTHMAAALDALKGILLARVQEERVSG